MNIGIIGAGNVGGTLGRRWAAKGHKVVFASRTPDSDKIRALIAEAGPLATAATAAAAASASDVLVLSTPWEAARQALQDCGDLAGKILIDATNPILPGLAGLSVGTASSAGEQVAAWAPGAKVVKALNSVGYNIMADPKFEAGRAVMFYCGDDWEAKSAVRGLLEELGFEAIDAGPLKQARLLEPFAMLWITLAYAQGFGREIGFAFLRRSEPGNPSTD